MFQFANKLPESLRGIQLYRERFLVEYWDQSALQVFAHF